MKFILLFAFVFALSIQSFGQSEYFDIQIKRINKAISNGDYATAKKYLDITEQKFPDSSRVFLEKAGYYYFQDSLQAAMKYFLLAESMGNKSVQINKYVGMLHHRKGEDNKAQARYRIYLNAVPEDVFIWSKYALILFEKKAFDQLIAECSNVDTTNKLSAPIYGMLCNAHTRESEHELALKNIQYARKLDPFNQQWQYYEAVVHHNLKNQLKSCEMMHVLMQNGYFEYYSTYKEYDCNRVLDVNNNGQYDFISPPPPPPEIIIEE